MSFKYWRRYALIHKENGKHTHAYTQREEKERRRNRVRMGIKV